MLPERKNFQDYIGMGVACWDNSIGCAVKSKIASVTVMYIDGCEKPQIVSIRLYHRGKGRPGDDPMFDSFTVNPEQLYRNKCECARAHFSKRLHEIEDMLNDAKKELDENDDRKRILSERVESLENKIKLLVENARCMKWHREIEGERR